MNISTSLAGVEHYGASERTLRSPLTLRREPGNAHDPNAVQVLAGETVIGYLPGSRAAEVVPRMDRGDRVSVTPTWSAFEQTGATYATRAPGCPTDGTASSWTTGPTWT